MTYYRSAELDVYYSLLGVSVADRKMHHLLMTPSLNRKVLKRLMASRIVSFCLHFLFVYSPLVHRSKVRVIISIPSPILNHLHLIGGLRPSQRSPAGRQLSPDVLRKTEHLCWVSGAWQGWIGLEDWGQASSCFNHLSGSLSRSKREAWASNCPCWETDAFSVMPSEMFQKQLNVFFSRTKLGLCSFCYCCCFFLILGPFKRIDHLKWKGLSFFLPIFTSFQIHLLLFFCETKDFFVQLTRSKNKSTITWI